MPTTSTSNTDNTVDNNAINAVTNNNWEINVAEFLSVCVYLAEQAGNILREVHDSGNLGQQYKGHNQGSVTVADILA